MKLETDIFPAFIQPAAPIVFESSGYFIPYLSIALQSMINSSSPDTNYDVIILCDKVKDIDKERLLGLLCDHENFSLRFFDVSGFVSGFIKSARYSYITVNYYRMALPWILKNYDRAVNLGADILIKKDINTLCTREFTREDAFLAGAPDLGYIGRLKEDIPQSELDLRFPREYVNADILIFNLKRIRECYSLDEMMAFWQKYHFRCAEQDALNKLFDGHKEMLDLHWNTYPDRMTSTVDIMCTTEEEIALWKECLKDPALVHFAAVPKPWSYPVIGYGDDWWKLARQSLYYEEILRRMANQKSKRNSSFREMLDLTLPKGTQRRELAKKLKPVEKWGLNTRKKTSL